MTVKIDEDLPTSLRAILNASGYLALTVHDQGWAGAPDAVLFPLVQQEREFLLTGDMGFANLQTFPPGAHQGILVLRSVDQTIESYDALLNSVLKQHDLRRHVGHVIVASELVTNVYTT